MALDTHGKLNAGGVMAKTALSKKKALFVSTSDLNLGKELVKFYIWVVALCGAETWTVGKVDQKYLEKF
jgi:hypothetical protein